MGQIARKGQLHRLACQPLRLAAQQRQGDPCGLVGGASGLAGRIAASVCACEDVFGSWWPLFLRLGPRSDRG
jgi:hypothetical protein